MINTAGTQVTNLLKLKQTLKHAIKALASGLNHILAAT